MICKTSVLRSIRELLKPVAPGRLVSTCADGIVRAGCRSGLRATRSGLVFAALVFSSSLAQAAGESPIIGEWTGNYRCGSVEAPFTLTLEEARGALLEGEIHFSVPAGGPDGAFRVRGRYMPEDRSFNLTPSGWIKRPPGWHAAGLTGTINENGLTIGGTLRGCAGGRGNNAFSAQRGDAAVTADGALAVTADQPVPRTGGAFEGRWTGVMACRQSRQPDRDLPMAINLVQDGDTVTGFSTMTLEDGDLRQYFTGKVEDGDLILEKLFETHRVLDLDVLRLQGSGERLKVTIEDAWGWRNWDCNLSVRRAGPPEAPSAGKLEKLVGTWSGLKTVRRTYFHQIKRQARVVITEKDGQFYGLLDLALPFTARPVEQERFAIAIHPVRETDDGRIVFASTRVIRAEGSFANRWNYRVQRRYSWMLPVLSLESDGTLLVDATSRAYLGKLLGSKTRLRRASAEQIARLEVGEGPPVPLPPAISGRLGAAVSIDEQCRVLRDWAEPVSGHVDLGRMTRSQGREAILPLFDDAHFEPVFGLPYSLMSEAERANVQGLVHSRMCPRRIGLGSYYFSAIKTAFGDNSSFDRMVGMLIDRQETKQWHETAMVEIGRMPLEGASLKALKAFETEAAARAEEIPPDGRAELEKAIAGKRSAIAAAGIMKRVAEVPSLPDTRATLEGLSELVSDASSVRLAAADETELRRVASAKAEAITTPLIADAIASAKAQPASLEGLGEVTRIQRDIDRLIDDLGPQLGAVTAREQAAPLRDIRQGLIDDPAIQASFRRELAAIKPGGGDAEAAVLARAQRFVDLSHLRGASAIPAYADAAASAIRSLEIRSIQFADRSTVSVEGEPTAEEMLFAVKATVDQVNNQLSSKFERCQRREFRNDPLMAMECLTILATGGGAKVKARLTQFEKLGCSDAVVYSGYICDYVLGFATNGAFMQGRIGELMGSGSVAKGRFVPVDGGWLFTRLE